MVYEQGIRSKTPKSVKFECFICRSGKYADVYVEENRELIIDQTSGQVECRKLGNGKQNEEKFMRLAILL